MPLTLVFLKSGHAILEEDDKQAWASDDDEDFEEEIGTAKLDEEDTTTVLVYLQEHDIITELEAQMITVQVEEDEDDEVIDADYEIVDPPARSH